ncbi:ATP-dependent DNA ligase [Candidatus Woesearchaeota archaeon]|nr:ATP-dependent DNA ligase [Candidatus Woesearchaeota archaeon]
MDFQKLVDVYEELEKTSSGNQMREILAEFFKTVPKENIATITYLTLGQIASDYEGVVLGLAEKSILKAIKAASGLEEKKIISVLHETGDVGLAAEQALQKKPRTLVPVGKLAVHELFATLHKIAETSGTGSQEQKTNLLVSLLQKASPKGAKYLTRIVLGTLRMGVGDMTVLDALALCYTGEKKNKEQLERAYNICPDVGIIAETLAKKGLAGIEKMDIHLGRPIKMMLAQRIEALEELPKKMPGKVSVEGKYDGERVQAHRKKDGEIVLFSRRMENITEQFPDLMTYLQKQLPEKEYVVEGEILAIDEKGNPLPFQTLMQRRRKYDVAEYMKKIPIQIKLFDVLFLNGKSYLHEPYEQRVHVLKKMTQEGKHVRLAERFETDDVPKLSTFFKDMLKKGYEGIMIKSLSGEYQAGTRGWNWIKWKKEYEKEMADTFDLVVVGAFYGRGRRKGVYGALLCAAYNHEKDAFETVTKVGTGLTDEQLAALPKHLAKYQTDKKPARLIVEKEMVPDVWFEPKVVLEVTAAEITQSPFHSLGYALRFPRFVRFRDDKKAEQATTSKEIKQMARK